MESPRILIQSIILLLMLVGCSATSADMLISPVRILMDNANSSATMTLRNTSDGPRTFRLSWEDKRAKQNGGYTDIKEGENWPVSAKDMLRFSPRQILVGAGENQTIRFNWRPPSDLPSGEYRSHLLLAIVPDVSEPSAIMTMAGSEEGIGIEVNMQMSFSIPVVVRNNTDAPTVSIENVKAIPSEDGRKLALEVDFNRSGNASSFGNISVEMQRDADSTVEIIGQKQDFSIYPELDSRKATISLRDSTIPAGAIVRIAYEGAKEYRGILWDEKIFKAE